MKSGSPSAGANHSDPGSNVVSFSGAFEMLLQRPLRGQDEGFNQVPAVESASPKRYDSLDAAFEALATRVDHLNGLVARWKGEARVQGEAAQHWMRLAKAADAERDYSIQRLETAQAMAEAAEARAEAVGDELAMIQIRVEGAKARAEAFASELTVLKARAEHAEARADLATAEARHAKTSLAQAQSVAIELTRRLMSAFGSEQQAFSP